MGMCSMVFPESSKSFSEFFFEKQTAGEPAMGSLGAIGHAKWNEPVKGDSRIKKSASWMVFLGHSISHSLPIAPGQSWRRTDRLSFPVASLGKPAETQWRGKFCFQGLVRSMPAVCFQERLFGDQFGVFCFSQIEDQGLVRHRRSATGPEAGLSEKLVSLGFQRQIFLPPAPAGCNNLEGCDRLHHFEKQQRHF